MILQADQTANEDSNSSEAMSSTTASEEPHTMLVEFSSVVADTQEYIIEVITREGKEYSRHKKSHGYVQAAAGC